MPSTVAVKNAWSLQQVNDADEGRWHDGLWLGLDPAAGAANNKWRSGVISSLSSSTTVFDLLVQQQASPNMSVFVAPGKAAIDRPSHGPYGVNTLTSPTLTVNTADPTNPRLDLVYLQILDSALGDGSLNTLVGITAGTPAGVPSLPNLPSTGISIPLAKIAVAANAASIVQANITDLRNSAGPVGSSRVLLGGDSAATAGRVYGEGRIRLLSSYGNFVSEELWGVDSAWHGTQELTPSSYTWLNGSSNITIATSNTGLISVAIPDPGWAYKLRVSGQIDYGAYGTFTAGAPPFCQGFVTLTTATGTVLSQGNGFAQSATGSFDGWTSIPVKTSGVLTGAQTVFLVGKGSVAMNSAFSSFGANATVLNVDIVPV